jgi:serine/threonine-protein kinase
MIPRQIGNYRLEDLLGSGGMGEVYRAYDTHRDRYVALKLLPEAFSGDEDYLRRFRRESHVAARLRDPHVIPIHDFGEIDGRLFIDMRLVDGADIGALLDKDGRISPQRAVNLLSQVAEALDAAHADRLVHRDIKPSNILVTLSDFVYVVDFGIARSMGDRQTALTTTGATIGTLNYMAPERFSGHAIDGRADVYSLACVLYECLTGTTPFHGRDLPALIYAHLSSTPPQASSVAEGVPPALDAVIARGMAKEPADRFATAGELAAAAREALLTQAKAPETVPVPVIAAAPQPPVWTEAAAPAWGTVAAAWSGEVPPTEAAAPAWGTAAAWSGAAPATEAAAPAWGTVAAAAAVLPGEAQLTSFDAGPAGGRPAPRVPASPTETVFVGNADSWGGSRPPQNLARDFGPPPGDHRPPPAAADERPARKPAWRRLGLLIVAAAVALAIPVVLVLMATSKPKPGVTAAPGAGATRAASAASGTGSTVNSAAASVAVPTVAEKIVVGQTPSYIQVAPNGKFAYLANPGANVITVLNTASDKVTGTIHLPQGQPQFISFSPDSQTAYVSVYNGNASVHFVAFIDTAKSTVTSTVPVDNYRPGPTTTSPDGRYLYVPNHNMGMSAGQNVIDVIDTTSAKVTSRIATPANPHWIVFGKNGLFYATDHMSATVTVLNAHNNGIVAEMPVGETPHGIAISPDGSRLAVTSYSGNQVFVVSTATNQDVARIPVGRTPLEITYSPDGRYIFTVSNEDNEVTVISAAENRVIAELPAGKAPTSISVLPNGRQAYVTDEGDGTIEVINIPK